MHTDLLEEHHHLKADGSLTPKLNRDQIDERARPGPTIEKNIEELYGVSRDGFRSSDSHNCT